MKTAEKKSDKKPGKNEQVPAGRTSSPKYYHGSDYEEDEEAQDDYVDEEEEEDDTDTDDEDELENKADMDVSEKKLAAASKKTVHPVKGAAFDENKNEESNAARKNPAPGQKQAAMNGTAAKTAENSRKNAIKDSSKKAGQANARSASTKSGNSQAGQRAAIAKGSFSNGKKTAGKKG